MHIFTKNVVFQRQELLLWDNIHDISSFVTLKQENTDIEIKCPNVSNVPSDNKNKNKLSNIDVYYY